MKKLLLWTKRIILVLVLLIFSLAVSGGVYQYVGTAIDATKHPPLGRLIDVGGYQLHMHCMGEGGPTVVLDSGLGCNCLEWALVQPEIAKWSKVCSYDRAGYGWSDESPYPRTCEQIVEELHALLHQANIQPPFVLVGHSFGGLNVQSYAKRYPNEVVGLVLVDSAHEQCMERLPKAPELNWVEKALFSPRLGILATQLGVRRLMMQFSEDKQGLQMIPEPTRDMILATQNSTKQVSAASNEYSNFQINLQQQGSIRPSFGNLPLTVIAAGNAPNTDGMPEDRVQYFQQFLPAWKLLQQDLVTRSSNGKLITAEHSDHMIPFHQPEIIVEAVRQMIDDCKLESKAENEVKLDVVYIAQNDKKSCATTSVAMAISYYEQLKDAPLNKDKVWNISGTDEAMIKQYGNDMDGLKRIADHYGYKSKYLEYMEVSDVERFLSDGIPVMLNILFSKQSSVTHAILVVGYNKNRRIFYINDPANDQNKIVEYSDLESRWSAHLSSPRGMSHRSGFIVYPKNIIPAAHAAGR